MKRTIIAAGSTGACVAQAFLHTAATGVAAQIDEINILLTGSQEDPAVRRLMATCVQYESFQKCCGYSIPQVSIRYLKMEKTQVGANDSDLLRAFFGIKELDSISSSAVYYEKVLDGGLQEYLTLEPDSHFVLCGSLCGACASAAMPVIARKIRQDIQGSARVDMIAVLPYYSIVNNEPASLEAQENTSRMLQMYADANLIAADENDTIPAVDSCMLIGMPEDAVSKLKAEEQYALHMVHLIAARNILDAFLNNNRFGVYTYRIAQPSFTWSSFGDDAGRFYRSFTCMAESAALYRAHMYPELRKRLDGGRSLQLRRDWYTQWIGDARKLADRDGQIRYAKVNDDYYRAWCGFMSSVIHSMPPQLRDLALRNMAIELAGEAYRKLLNAAGELYIMQRQIAESGMEEQQIVHRGQIRETSTDKYLMRAKQLREETALYEKSYAQHVPVIGGLAQYRLFSRMLNGVNHAIEVESGHVADELQKLKQDKGIAPQAYQAERDRIHRTQLHLDILIGMRERINKDLITAQAQRNLPPAVAGEKYYPTNDLFNGQLLALIAQQEVQQQKDQIKQLWSSLLPQRIIKDPQVKLRELAEEAPGISNTTMRLPAMMCELRQLLSAGEMAVNE